MHRDWEPSSELADGVTVYAGAGGKLALAAVTRPA